MTRFLVLKHAAKKGRLLVILSAVLATLAGIVVPTAPAAPGKYTIRLDIIGVAFELPRGYAVLQQENHEGFYDTIIFIGKEFRAGHLKRAPLSIVFWPAAYDGVDTVTGHKPSQYVDVEFERIKEGRRQQPSGPGGDPQYTTLFGNKAVRYIFDGLADPLGDTVIVGYLDARQLPKQLALFTEEYQVRIVFDESDKGLSEPVLGSLRVIK